MIMKAMMTTAASGAPPGKIIDSTSKTRVRAPGREPMTRLRRYVVLAAASVALVGAASSAAAQTINSAVNLGLDAPLEQLPPPKPIRAIDAPAVERLFGDWDGLQTTLLSNGVNLQLNALTEFAGNVSGGVKQGATFSSQVGLYNDINWERLAGIVGLSTHIIIVSRSGNSDSALFGDHLLPVQEIYG